MQSSTVNPNRWVPPSMNAHFDYMENANCEVFYTSYPIKDKWYAIAYQGKSKKSVWHYSFRTEERMMQYINEYVEGRKLSEKNKVERKAEQKQKNAEVKVNVGDLFYTSYGYDQTNINFYMVTEVKNKTVTVVEIGASTVPGSEGFMCCHVTPNKSVIHSAPFTKRLLASYDGSPTFKISSFEHARLTTETSELYCSWYA